MMRRDPANRGVPRTVAKGSENKTPNGRAGGDGMIQLCANHRALVHAMAGAVAPDTSRSRPTFGSPDVLQVRLAAFATMAHRQAAREISMPLEPRRSTFQDKLVALRRALGAQGQDPKDFEIEVDR